MMMRTRLISLAVAIVVMFGFVVPAAGASRGPDDLGVQVAVVIGAVTEPGSIGNAELSAAVTTVIDAAAAGEVTAQSLLDMVMPLIPGLLDWLVANAESLVTALLPILPVLVDAVTQLVSILSGGGSTTTTIGATTTTTAIGTTTTTTVSPTTTTTVPATTTTTTRCWFFCG